jgi:hypothetical protein
MRATNTRFIFLDGMSANIFRAKKFSSLKMCVLSNAIDGFTLLHYLGHAFKSYPNVIHRIFNAQII